MAGKSIYHVHHDKTRGFSVIDNAWVNNPILSAKEKGILLYLLAKPDDWQVYERDIVNHMADGKHSINAGIHGLISKGYMIRKQRRNEHGHFRGYIYHVYESPKPENPITDNPPLLSTDLTKHRKQRRNGRQPPASIHAYHQANNQATDQSTRTDVEAAGLAWSEDHREH